jgi:Tfp pilus assembly protein FimT
MKSLTNEQGFSILEICVTVVIVGLLGLLAVNPAKNYIRRLEFNNSAHNIKRLIGTAQSRAMANPNVHIGVYFDLTRNPHKVFLFQDKEMPGFYQYDGAGDPAYLQPETLKRGAVFKPIPGYPREIVFRGDGSAYKSMKIVITDGILKDTLDILASTGRISRGR